MQVLLSVVYHANGGNNAPPNAGGTLTVSNVPVYVNYTLSSTVPWRTGYDFLGWASSPSATSASWQPGGVARLYITSTGTNTFNFYAVWKPKEYVVFYRKGTYGTGTDTSAIKTADVDLTLLGSIFTRSGYYQTGWSTNANGTSFAYGLGAKYSTNAGITLYPFWKIRTSTISSVTDSVPADGTTQGTVSINRPNANFTHTVLISLGTRSQEFTNVGTSLSFTIPAAWIDQIPNATSAVATVTLTTYNNGSQVGTPDTKSFVVTVPSSIVPTITLTGTNQSSNNTVSGWNVLVQGYSQIALTAATSAGSGATITSIAFSGDGVSQIGAEATVTSELLTSAGSKTWTATVTDSRGRTATATLTRTVHEYYPTAILAFSAFRSTQEGNASPSGGQYITASGNYSYASCDGHNFATVKKIEYKIHNDSTWTQGEGAAASGTVYTFGPISLLYIYDVRLTVTDALGSSAAYTVNVASVRGVSFGLNGRCARFGGPVQYDDRFECDWDVQFDGQIEAPLFLQTGFVAAEAVEPGTTRTVQVDFDTPFLTQPYVAFSMTSPQTVDMDKCSASSWNITETGFSARLTNGSEYNRTLGICWIATARKDINVAIIDQPISLTVDDGDTVTFSVVAVNATKYQWYVNDGFDWTEISGDMAKTSSYTFEASSSQSGYMFKCVASNNYGAIESDAATLTIRGVVPTDIVDITPYIKRESGGGLTIGNKMIDKIVGGTIAWNQLCNGSSTSVTNGHKYVAYIGGSWSVGASNGTAITTDASTDKIYDITQMFGSVIADYIYSLEQSTANAGVAWFRSLFPNDYVQNVGELMSVNTSAHIMKDASENIVGSYQLDSSITLRGIPKLDANNNLYYDGDTYESDGTVTRRYGVVDLGTLTWTAKSLSNNRVAYVTSYASWDDAPWLDKPDLRTPTPAVCVAFDHMVAQNVSSWGSNVGVFTAHAATLPVKSFAIIKDSGTYADAAAFKTAMDGVYLVYKLETPTTETADPYTNPQVVDPNGTEEYVDYAESQGLRDVSIPVGHETKYKTPN